MKIRQKIVLLLLLMPVLLGVSQAGQPNVDDLQRDALAGDAWAQLNLGAAYDHGLAGLPEDPAMAIRWYRKSAEQGLDKAQFNLAHCLATGRGVNQDYAQARFWMRKAAVQGMADAQFLMGVMLLEGLGGESDPAAAKVWLGKAQAGGNPNAAEYLKKLP